MSEIYRVHFGFSKRSKYYPQAIEIADLSNNHEVKGDGDDRWHIVTFNGDQIDLMAGLYGIATKLPNPKIYGADYLTLYLYCSREKGDLGPSEISKKTSDAASRLMKEMGATLQETGDYVKEAYSEVIRNDHAIVNQLLTEMGYLQHYILDENGKTCFVDVKIKPSEHIKSYTDIKDLIVKGKFDEAIDKYYVHIGNNFFGELHPELIYLKRLANAELSGRDLLYYKSESSRNDVINADINEYVECINKVLEQHAGIASKSPLAILKEYAPTMEELIKKRKHEWHKGVRLWKGKIKTDNTPVTPNSFSAEYDFCPKGRIFSNYPDQVKHCRVLEIPEDKRYHGLWTIYSPSFIEKKIYKKGYHFDGIEAYRYKMWGRRSAKREPDFTNAKSKDDIEVLNIGTGGVRFTGRTHKIKWKKYYEIDLLRRNADKAIDLGNPFLELVDEICREAENALRKRKGLPRIGEGWISETRLYYLFMEIFPDAEQHASPSWIKPQHLDIYIPSIGLAIEYQGQQHFKPLEFFGGEEAYNLLVKRDKRKQQKCKKNKIILLHWHYNEAIDKNLLLEKLNDLGIHPPSIPTYNDP